MEINEEHIRDLMEVYRMAYKIELTHDETRQMLQRLILMFESFSQSGRTKNSQTPAPDTIKAAKSPFEKATDG